MKSEVSHGLWWKANKRMHLARVMDRFVLGLAHQRAADARS